MSYKELNYELPVGRYSISLKRTGYIDKKVFFNVEKDKTKNIYMEAETYRVIFRPNISISIPPIYIKYGQTIPLPIIENIPEGYEFVGWYTDRDYSIQYNSTNIPTQNGILYPKFSKIIYNVIFRAMGEDIDIQQVEHGGVAPLPTPPIVEGHQFRGWIGNYINVQKDELLEAIYEINMYTVRFVSMQGMTEEQVPHGGAPETPEDPPDLYDRVFIEWDKNFDIIKENTIIYAQYQHVYHTIRFIGMNNQVLLEREVVRGQTVTPPNGHVFAGFEFKGWDPEDGHIRIEDNIDIYGIYE